MSIPFFLIFSFSLASIVSCYGGMDDTGSASLSSYGSGSSLCEDIQPDRYSCEQQKAWGKCERWWMISNNWCRATCGHCSNKGNWWSEGNTWWQNGNDPANDDASAFGGENDWDSNYASSSGSGDTEASDECYVYNNDSLASEGCENTTGCFRYEVDAKTQKMKEDIHSAMFKFAQDNKNCYADIAVAMAMQEHHSLAPDASNYLNHDASKDNDEHSRNVSIFNMNIHWLENSCGDKCKTDYSHLNHLDGLDESVELLYQGFQVYGVDLALRRHRGGSSGQGNVDGDEGEFARKIKSVAWELRNDTALRKNATRVAHSIDPR